MLPKQCPSFTLAFSCLFVAANFTVSVGRAKSVKCYCTTTHSACINGTQQCLNGVGFCVWETLYNSDGTINEADQYCGWSRYGEVCTLDTSARDAQSRHICKCEGSLCNNSTCCECTKTGAFSKVCDVPFVPTALTSKLPSSTTFAVNSAITMSAASGVSLSIGSPGVTASTGSSRTSVNTGPQTAYPDSSTSSGKTTSNPMNDSPRANIYAFLIAALITVYSP